MVAEPLIELRGVAKVFSAGAADTHALSSVHLTVDRGEFVCIAGPSGCGKTTLLSILGLLDTPSRGTYLLEGRDVGKMGAAARAALRNRTIGFIFQSFNLIGDMTVAENIELPLIYRGWPAGRRGERVAEALDRVGLAHRARHMPGQLSGGQQQRVAVARAIAGEPAILLADEPTGNLDSSNGEAVMEILRDLHQGGATICMVTHNDDYGAQAERRVSLFDGRIVEETERPAA
jgi:putative ABC transport system ATP-binding protein